MLVLIKLKNVYFISLNTPIKIIKNIKLQFLYYY